MFIKYRHHQKLLPLPTRWYEGEGGGGGTPSEAELLAQAERKVEKQGAVNAVLEMMNEGFKYRERIRDLEGTQVPDGAVVLQGEDATAWEAFKALGKPDEVKGKLDAAVTAEADLAKERRRTLIRDAAGLTGFKPNVLEDRLNASNNLVLELTGEGDKQQAVIKEGDKATPLTDYAEAQWGDYLPALKAEARQGSRLPGVRDTGTPPKAGEAMVNAVLEQNKARAAAPNPLRPAPATT